MLYNSKCCLLGALGLIILASGCSSNSETAVEEEGLAASSRLSVQFSKGKSVYCQTDTIDLQLAVNESGFVPDSVAVLFDSSQLVCRKQLQSSERILPQNLTIGYHSVVYKYYAGDKSGANTLSVTVLPSAPIERTFNVKASYKHDTAAYTQGLLIDDGTMFEGTGLYGQSSLRRVDMKSGKVLQQINIDSQVFGEGITVIDQKLYQITWQSNVGYVYDKKTFNRLREFTYPTEGWGLTFDGTQLIMSDGSEYLYFIDTASLQRVSKVAVFDNIGAVTRLNELEYVDGFVYANIYTTNVIVKIDPKSGAVIERINFSGLMSDADKTPTMDVLNGIAWDSKLKKMYVTGKKWSKLYEIEVK